MAAVLDTVGDYVAAARAILQDTTVPYRYADADLITALGIGVFEMRRVRPDIFAFITTMPDITAATGAGTEVSIERWFRYPLVHFMVGQVQLRDEEEGAEGRAAAFLQSFRDKILGMG